MALHFNVLTGVDWYGSGSSLYLIPFIGFAITIANFILFRALGSFPGFVRSLSAVTSFVVQIILLSATLFLMQVN
jgi:hypothetical protein